MKNVILAVVSLSLLVAASSVDAQNAEGDWIADAKTGCKVWVPDYSSNMSVTWTGRCKQGKAEGEGELECYEQKELSMMFFGTMKDDEMTGQGTAVPPTGYQYTGEIKHGRMEGKGEAIFPYGEKYKGDFKDGIPNGVGILFLNNGDTYFCEWIEGKMNGKGTYTYNNGNSYQGIWNYCEQVKQ